MEVKFKGLFSDLTPSRELTTMNQANLLQIGVIKPFCKKTVRSKSFHPENSATRGRCYDHYFRQHLAKKILKTIGTINILLKIVVFNVKTLLFVTAFTFFFGRNFLIGPRWRIANICKR
jgi:hypothetical protein